MKDFFERLKKHPKLKRDIIECVIADIIVFLVAYLLKEAPIAYAGLILLIVIIYGLYKRIKREFYNS